VAHSCAPAAWPVGAQLMNELLRIKGGLVVQ